MRASYSRGVPEHDELYPLTVRPTTDGKHVLENQVTGQRHGDFDTYVEAEAQGHAIKADAEQKAQEHAL